MVCFVKSFEEINVFTFVADEVINIVYSCLFDSCQLKCLTDDSFYDTIDSVPQEFDDMSSRQSIPMDPHERAAKEEEWRLELSRVILS